MGHLEDLYADLDRRLSTTDRTRTAQRLRDHPDRRPVHTVYVPAHRYDAATVAEWGSKALAAMDQHAGSAEEFADAIGMEPALGAEVYGRVRSKLTEEPIEDLRIDFEDGYGAPAQRQEDADAVAAAQALAGSVATTTPTPWTGIRVKSLEPDTRRRALRTLDLFVGTSQRAGGLPSRFVVTFPKITSVDQVKAMDLVCGTLEAAHGLAPGGLSVELQIESPQAILGPDGTAPVAQMVRAAAGRCVGLHFGTYDYTAACGIAAAYQSMEHPAADHAKAVMQVAAAGSGVALSDGSTNVVPVGDRAAVHRAWQLHARLVRRSLERGFYQGWDLHPAQLPTRFAATFAFFREGWEDAAGRLEAYVAGADSRYVDEPATASALAGFLMRALQCGAVDEAETKVAAGFGRDELRRLTAPHPDEVAVR